MSDFVITLSARNDAQARSGTTRMRNNARNDARKNNQKKRLGEPFF